MLVLEAIKLKVSKSARGHLDDATFELALLERGLSGTETFTAISEEFELATADVLVVLSTGVGVEEGGVSFTKPEAKSLMKQANKIYDKYNDPASTTIKVPRGKARQSW